MAIEQTKVTLIFLLYNAQETVEALVDAAVAQRHPFCPDQADWLDVVFMDDSSQDNTLKRLHFALEKANYPRNFRVVANERNLGLSGTLNKAFGLIKTPYGLTCHIDVLFGREDYVAAMLSLMESHPEAGAITGQPHIPSQAEISTAEKLNLICNLMDIFPVNGNDPLIPIGFAEGRCDIFRVEALRKAGFWDTTLRVSGEDQILAFRMRQNGYQIYQAPYLPYYLSVSGEQNSIGKLLKHAHLFGRTQPYILLSHRKTLASSAGQNAGYNRRARLILRGSHLAGTAAYLTALAGGLAAIPPWIWATPLVVVALLKGILFRRHLRAAHLKASEFVPFFTFVPLQDIYYTIGLVQGTWNYFRCSAKGVIR